MTDDICARGEDGRAYIPMAEYERVRAKKELAQKTLVDMARLMNSFADAWDLLSDREPPERRDPPDWAKPTEPAPLE